MAAVESERLAEVLEEERTAEPQRVAAVEHRRDHRPARRVAVAVERGHRRCRGALPRLGRRLVLALPAAVALTTVALMP